MRCCGEPFVFSHSRYESHSLDDLYSIPQASTARRYKLEVKFVGA